MNASEYHPSIEDISAQYIAADDLNVAASILYNAYFDDPLFKDIFEVDKEGYESRLRSAIREELNAFWDAQQPIVGLYEQGRLIAVTCLIGPDAAFGAGRYWHWKLKMLLTAGFFGTKQMIAKEELVRAAVPAENYHMLSFIGVHTDHQDMGLGHILMSAIAGLLQENVKTEGIAVFVTLPKCLSFFKDGQFEPVKDIEVGKVTGKLMFRKK
jgi:ribosomal protein S18 acetylase RimI-like enzyme